MPDFRYFRDWRQTTVFIKKASFRRKMESGLFKALWMPDQVRHKGLIDFINRHYLKRRQGHSWPCLFKDVLSVLTLFFVLLNNPYRVARLYLGLLPVMGKRAFHR